MGTTTMPARVRRMVGATAVAVALLMTAPTAPAGAGGATVGRPDLLVSKDGVTFKGDGIYNGSGAGQSLTRSTARGAIATFKVTVQNDGPESGIFKMQGCASNSNFRVRYFALTSLGTIDDTPLWVNGAQFSYTPDIDVPWEVQIKVKPSAPAGATLTCTLRLSDVSSPSTIRDVVRLTVRRS